jgi:hypothetical protein
MLLPRMIDDMLKLTIDKIFPQSHQAVIFGPSAAPEDSPTKCSSKQESSGKNSQLKWPQHEGVGSRLQRITMPSMYPVRGHKDSTNMW